jgi:hypothetical protein
MATIIDPEEDYLTIVAAEEKVAQSDARKKKELDDAQANLKGSLVNFYSFKWAHLISQLFRKFWKQPDYHQPDHHLYPRQRHIQQHSMI